MDSDRFDTLARALDPRSRRRVLGTLSGAILGVLASVVAVPRTGARKKKGKKCPTCPGIPAAPICAQTCGTCLLCYSRAADSNLCGNSGLFQANCNSSCSSDNDCAGTAYPYCVTHYQDPGSAEKTAICGSPGGYCTSISGGC